MRKKLLLGLVLTGLMHVAFAGTPTDVTSNYLGNYTAPFATTSETLIGDNARWQILAAPWITEGDVGTKGVDYTTWHVDFDKMPYYPAQDNSRLGAMALTPGWDGFSGTFQNMKVYQTVTLPAASYEFIAQRAQDWTGAAGAYLVAAAGKGIPNIESIATSLGSTRFNTAVAPDWKVTVYFKLDAETEVSLGAVATYAGAQQSVTLSDFTLLQILGANYNPLNNLLTRVKGYNTTTQYPVLGTYAEAQWNTLQTAITAADAFVALGTEGSQEEVDAQVTAINTAVHNLDSVAELPILVYQAKKYDATQYPIGVVMGTYPQATWDAFKAALQVAETFIAKTTVTAEEIETNTAALQSAISALNGSMILPFKFSNDTDTYWYQIHDMRDPQSWWQIGPFSNEDGTKTYPFALIMTQMGDNTLDDQLFKFVKAPAPLQGFYIYSKLIEESPLNGSLVDNVVTIDPDSVPSTWQLGKTVDPAHFTLFLEGKKTSQLNSYAYGYTFPYIAFYYPGDGVNDLGNNWGFIEVLTAGQTDFTELKTLVAKAIAMTEALYPVGGDENQYPADKWAAFVAARNVAVELVTKENNKPQPTQTEVDAMIVTLQTAIDDLKASQNPPIKVSTATENFWYWIHDKRATPSWWKIGIHNEIPGSLIMIKGVTLTEEQKSDSLLFKFVKAPEPLTGYYIFNKLDEVNGLVADEGSNFLAVMPDVTPTSFVYTPTGAGYYLMLVEETQSQLNSYAGHTPPYIAFWDGGASDPGNNWTFIPAPGATGVKNVSSIDYGVYAVGRRIIASNPDTRFEVYSISGHKMDALNEVNRGIYIVKVNGKPGALKLMVR